MNQAHLTLNACTHESRAVCNIVYIKYLVSIYSNALCIEILVIEITATPYSCIVLAIEITLDSN